MSSVERRSIGNVPVLLATPAGRHEPPPAVLWFHGLGADAAVHRPELELLARHGFLAVGVDAVNHGARRAPDLDARIAGDRASVVSMMLELVRATVNELGGLLGALVNSGAADPERISAVGISMGGYLIYRALPAHSMIGTAVALLGSPEWPSVDSPHLHPRAFDHAALMSITAERDESVPPDAARRFHGLLSHTHPQPQRLRYVELPGAAHLMDARSWEIAMDEMVRWLLIHNGMEQP